MKKLYFLMIIFLLLSSKALWAQGWEKRFPALNQIGDIAKTNTGGYVLLGQTSPPIIYKVSSEGDSIWKRILELSEMPDLTAIISTKDHGYALTGSGFNLMDQDALLVKRDSEGNALWEKWLGGSGHQRGSSLIQLSDSSYEILGSFSSPDNEGGIYLVKTDKNGNFLWEKYYPAVNSVGYNGRQIKATSDGGFLILGDNGILEGIYLAKTDSLGNISWQKNYGGINYAYGRSIDCTHDGGIIIGAESNGSAYLIKTDSLGNVIWSEYYGNGDYSSCSSALQTSDHGYVFTGMTFRSAAGGVDSVHAVFVVKTNELGDTLWTRKVSASYPGSYSTGIVLVESDDLGYVVGGVSGNAYLGKFDINGNTYVNTISGKLYNDVNKNCIKDSGEDPLINWLVKLEPGSKFTVTDSNGLYSFRENTGTFTITPVKKNELWAPFCPAGSAAVTFNSFFESSVKDFSFEAAVYCPLLSVDISTPFFRRCFTNTYTVAYSNQGTAPQSNVQIKIEFPDAIIPLSSSIPGTNIGNIYTYELGTLPIGASGKFTIVDSTDCLVALNSTHCVKAVITPYTSCGLPDPSWDKSSILVEGFCLTDSIVRFTIINTGDAVDGNMDGPSNFRIYFDNVLDSTGTFQLNGNDVQTIDVYSRGATVRLEADQRPGHPGHSRPRATVESCGSPSFGFVRMAMEDDEDEFIEIDCQEVRGSFDPNDKSVKPEGITEHHYIPRDAELEYLIRFQNTGTDTAFTVVVRDAISDNLDLTSLKMISASHTYEYKIITGEKSVVEWRFRNILLADSNINEPKSHGFLKYKIRQKPGLPEKSLIENTADIYFDYNEAVVTNTTRSVAFDTTILGERLTGIFKPLPAQNNIVLYPNPFSEKTIFEVKDHKGVYNFRLLDMKGKVVRDIPGINTNRFELKREDLLEGIYIYNIYSADGLMSTGKLVIMK